MSKNKIDIKQLFYRLQTQMETKLTTNREVVLHPGAKGDASEINWIQWLKEYLPKRYCVDKAFVVDCDNNISEQIDVVIYDRQYTPFIFNQDSIFYVPAESVYAIFEVKQELNKDYIEYAGAKAESVRSLKRTSAPIYHAGGKYDAKPHSKILAGILTLGSSWADPLGDKFEEHIIQSEIKQLNIGCCLKHGAFIVTDDNRIEKSSANEALIFFFLKFSKTLQEMGTISAMDIECYASALDSI